MKHKTIWAGILIGGILSVLLFPILSYLESNNPWTETRHDGICPLHAPPDQYVKDDFPGYFLSGDKRSCERTLEKGIITGDGQVFGGSLVCYDNVRYETNWKCITPILYYPIFDFLNPGGETAGLGIIFLPVLFIYGSIIGFIIGVVFNWVVVIIRKN